MTRNRTLSCSVIAFALSLNCCLAADRILFDRLGPTQAALFISNADGSVERPLTQPGSLDYNPSWAPKGDWIVFTSERDGSADLFRVHTDGTGLERLTDDPAYDDQAAFSPDGARIVFVSNAPADEQISGFLTLPAIKPRRLPQDRAAISALPGLQIARG